MRPLRAGLLCACLFAAAGTPAATAVPAGTDPTAGTGVPARTAVSAGTGVPAGTAASAEVDPRAMLADLWRAAVGAGETTLGFDAWLAEAGLGPAHTGPATPLPADQAGRTRAISERWLSRAGPVALGTAGRVVTVFGSAIPTAFCSPLLVCYIELEAGEVLTGTPSWGDSVRWQVLAKDQGLDPVTVVFEVKPAEDAGITNLVIPTDRRLYTINLVNDREVHTPILAFSYPDTAAREASEAIARADADAAAVRNAELARSGVQTDRGRVAAGDLDFGFRVDGRAAFRPVRVFADGSKTYIDLPPGFRGALPAIVAGPGETNAALNTRVAENGTRLVADRVITDIYLQSGRTRVRIRKAGS